jgi:hypothetical protein
MIFSIITICGSIGLLVISVCAPWVLSDKNTFLLNFINQELLAFLGITVTITLASGATLFLELNKLEEKISQPAFRKSKNCIKKSCYSLILLLFFSVCIVTIKPLTPPSDIFRAC